MNTILTILVTVTANVVGYFVCKWLDSGSGDN